jgi:hypothetical protein
MKHEEVQEKIAKAYERMKQRTHERNSKRGNAGMQRGILGYMIKF